VSLALVVYEDEPGVGQTIVSLIDPDSGEVVDLADAKAVTNWLYRFKEWQRVVVNQALDAASEAIYAELDRTGVYTLRADGLEVAGESRAAWLESEVVDSDGLYRDLMTLGRRGEVDPETVEAAFKTERSLTAAGKARLLRMSGEPAALVREHTTMKEPGRRKALRVKRTTS